MRELIRLGFLSHGTIGPISFQFVMSAAFEQPAVVVAGGKEGVRWQIYPHIKYLHTNGCLNCCKWDGCWLGGDMGKCKDIVKRDGKDVPRCFDMITPKQIVEAVYSYYEGGRLKVPFDKEYEELKRDFDKFQKEKK